jgi:hypothetical protein
MFCPDCKCEYRAGVTHCSDCGVALVDSLDQLNQQTAAPLAHAGVVAVWSGNDPAECIAVKDALTKADIPFVDQSSNAYFIFRSMRPKTEICVPLIEEERARKALLGFQGSVDLDELTPEEIASLELPESNDDSPDEAAIMQSGAGEDWDKDEPVNEVWKGDDEHFANTLIACLRENGIPSHKIAEGSRWLLVVRPEDEARAKEIVREVVEARPPE